MPPKKKRCFVANVTVLNEECRVLYMPKEYQTDIKSLSIKEHQRTAVSTLPF